MAGCAALLALLPLPLFSCFAVLLLPRCRLLIVLAPILVIARFSKKKKKKNVKD